MRRSETAKIGIKLTGGKIATILAQFKKKSLKPQARNKTESKKMKYIFQDLMGSFNMNIEFNAQFNSENIK